MVTQNAFRPATLQEALEIAAGEVIPYAGGTDLMVRKRTWAGTPASFDKPVLFLGHLPELKQIHQDDHWHVGAAVTLSQLLRLPNLPDTMLAALREMASPGIRNMGTIGGNIMNASPAADLLVPLLLLDGVALLQSCQSERCIPISQLVIGPGKTSLQSGELLTELTFSAPVFTHTWYQKVGTRKADSLSKLSFAGAATVIDGHLLDFRIALGAVAPTVIRLRDAESIVLGKPISEISIHLPALLNAYIKEIRPIDDQRSSATYRKETALHLIEAFCRKLIA